MPRQACQVEGDVSRGVGGRLDVDAGAVEEQADGVFAAREAGQVERGPVPLLTQILFVCVDIAYSKYRQALFNGEMKKHLVCFMLGQIQQSILLFTLLLNIIDRRFLIF